MPRIQLCHISELQTIDSRGFELTEISPQHNIFIVRNGNTIVAYRNSCPHNFAPLNWSPDIFLSYDNEYIQCANHGALFEINTGHCIYGPCNGQYLQRINLEIDNDTIFALI